MNGDGIDDVIIGAPSLYRSGDYGGSYVVYGQGSPPASVILEDLNGEDGFLLSGEGGGVNSAGDVNDDGAGDMIVTGPRDQFAYIVFGRMPDSCYADCDGSGGLDFFDFLCFQNLFAAGDPQADCDGSGGLDFFDFLCFQNAFAAGCP